MSAGSKQKDLFVVMGDTFTYAIRWETSPKVYKAISALTNAAPCAVTATAHGIPNGWPVGIESIKNMPELCEGKKWTAQVIDANDLILQNLNTADMRTYVSGGYLVYNTPVFLTGYTASMAIKSPDGSSTYLTLSTTDGSIIIDPVGCTITLNIAAAVSNAWTWVSAIYTLEMTDASGNVKTILHGNLNVLTDPSVYRDVMMYNLESGVSSIGDFAQFESYDQSD